MPEKRIKVLLVDDHELVLMGLTALFSRDQKFEIVGQAGSVDEAVSSAGKLKPDVVLLDIRLPDGNGFTACRKIKLFNKDIKILFLTAFASEEFVFEAIASQGDGYLLKEIIGEDLVKSIYDVMNGKSVLDPSVTGQLFNKVRSDMVDSPRKKAAMVSRQERNVLQHVSEGKTNKEIAECMKLSPKTVKNYLSNAMDKLGINRRAEAATFFIRYLEE